MPDQPESTDLPAAAPDASPSLSARDIALRVFAGVGLAFSAMLLIDYVHTPVFCGDHASGCDAVRNSPFARVLGVPLPVFGVGFFAAMLASAAMGARRALGLLGGVGVASGVVFMALQAWVVHAFCKLCLVVDASAISAGLLALLTARDAAAPLVRRARAPTLAWGLAALGLPLAYGVLQPPPARPLDTPVIEPMPEVIAREQVAGKATIVEFVDFECPFCRRQQEALAPVLASYGERVRLVRRNVPLSFHTHARGAARAACCAEEQGRGDRMSEALFRAEDLTPDGCERVAREAGVDMAAYRACLASQRPDVRLERDQNDARAARVGGLPTLWIGREKFEGFTSAEALRTSIDRAMSASSTPADASAQGAHRGT